MKRRSFIAKLFAAPLYAAVALNMLETPKLWWSDLPEVRAALDSYKGKDQFLSDFWYGAMPLTEKWITIIYPRPSNGTETQA